MDTAENHSYLTPEGIDQIVNNACESDPIESQRLSQRAVSTARLEIAKHHITDGLAYYFMTAGGIAKGLSEGEVRAFAQQYFEQRCRRQRLNGITSPRLTPEETEHNQ